MSPIYFREYSPKTIRKLVLYVPEDTKDTWKPLEPKGIQLERLDNIETEGAGVRAGYNDTMAVAL
jgi:hypothetical protein